MIVFASAITDLELYQSYAEPGIRLAAEPDSEVMPFVSVDSLFRSYNIIIERVSQMEDVEALVLLHQDSEIADPDFCSKLRESLADREVAIVGAAGAVGVRSLAWWEGSPTWGSFTHRYTEHGGGEIPAMSWDPDNIDPWAQTGEVDSIDGFVIGMSPWAIGKLRFDEALGSKLHGYDYDLCLQAREAGKKVVTQNLRVIHHHSLDLLGDAQGWIDAHVKLADKWEGRCPGVGPEGLDWKQRARLAEAELGATRLQLRAFEHQVGAKEAEARVKYWELEEEAIEMRNSFSWRITAPLRAIGNVFRKLRRRPADSSGA
jgi:Glycosyltransferase like family